MYFYCIAKLIYLQGWYFPAFCTFIQILKLNLQKRFLLSFSSFFTEITNLNRKNNYILGFTRKTFAYADNSYTIYLAYLIIVRKNYRPFKKKRNEYMYKGTVLILNARTSFIHNIICIFLKQLKLIYQFHKGLRFVE